MTFIIPARSASADGFVQDTTYNLTVVAVPKQAPMQAADLP